MSVRWFISALKNWPIIYPCAPWISTPSKPAFSERIAAMMKSSISCSTSIDDNALAPNFSLADGQTGASPIISAGDRMPA